MSYDLIVQLRNTRIPCATMAELNVIYRVTIDTFIALGIPEENIVLTREELRDSSWGNQEARKLGLSSQEEFEARYIETRRLEREARQAALGNWRVTEGALLVKAAQTGDRYNADQLAVAESKFLADWVYEPSPTPAPGPWYSTVRSWIADRLRTITGG